MVMSFFKEAILEPPARWARFRRSIELLPKKRVALLDLGSGPRGELGLVLGDRLKKYIAIDPLFVAGRAPKHWQVVKQTLVKKIPLPSESVDVVVSTAFIEHVNQPREIMAEAVRVLKKGGRLILTTPTPRAKRLLEFLAFDLGLLSKREIAEHKNYFDRDGLKRLLTGLPVKRIQHRYFELGLNNLLLVIK